MYIFKQYYYISRLISLTYFEGLRCYCFVLCSELRVSEGHLVDDTGRINSLCFKAVFCILIHKTFKYIKLLISNTLLKAVWFLWHTSRDQFVTSWVYYFSQNFFWMIFSGWNWTNQFSMLEINFLHSHYHDMLSEIWFKERETLKSLHLFRKKNVYNGKCTGRYFRHWWLWQPCKTLD